MLIYPQQSVSRKLRARTVPPTEHEAGFTLIELLVVMLLIGILAAIAIPSFIGQKTKAVDVQAKELARTAATTAEAIATEHDGNYDAVTVGELHKTELTIPIVASSANAYLSTAHGKGLEYSLTAKASDGDEFTITRNADGTVSRECVSSLTKTGCGGERTSTW